MKLIRLECLLMPNNEIMFHGRSLGFFTKEELKECMSDDEYLRKLKEWKEKLRKEFDELKKEI